MNRLIAIVGPSGVGKTALVHALSSTGKFVTAYEQHGGRPFQALFQQDRRYALANQVDYLLLRAEQERELRETGARIGLMDGGLDLDFHGFTRLFHSRGLLADPELDLCRRLYAFIRASLPLPDLFVRLGADEGTVEKRLSGRDRVNIASIEDTARFNTYLDEWLALLPAGQVLSLDVTQETPDYESSVKVILQRMEE